MAKTALYFFVLNIQVLVLASYTAIFGACITICSNNITGILILSYLPITVFYHYRLAHAVRMNREDFKNIFFGNDCIKELCMCFSGVNFVFCKIKGCNYFSEVLKTADLRWPLTLLLARLLIIGSVIGWFFDYDRSSQLQLAFISL